MLTELQLKKKNTGGKRLELWDGNGLGIRMGSKKKSWIFKYSIDGQRRQITLGEYPNRGLTEARLKAAEAAAKIKRGIDPATEMKAEREARRAAPTMAQLVDEFWQIELCKKKSGKETRRLLTYDVLPTWGKRKVKDVKRRNIVLLLDKIRERAPITANRVHSALSRLFNFAAERGIIDDSPCTRIRKAKETAKSRTLTDDEISKLWAALDPENMKIDIFRVTKLAIKMLLLTGQRPGEVVGMEWGEVEGDTWTIPRERMKGQEEHKVPLTRLALEVIQQAQAYSGDSPYVFRSSRKDGAHITPAAVSRAVFRHLEEIGIETPFTPHDCRRTVRTRLAELGVDDVVAERVVGHKLQGMLGVYNRHGYDKEKRQALEKWEGKLRLIVGLDEPEPAKVIEMRNI